MSVKDELERLFGPLEIPPFDEEGEGSFAIPNRPRTGALPTAADLETGTTDELKQDPLQNLADAVGIDRYAGSQPADDSGFFEDNARLLGAGTVQAGEMILGAGEYVAQQNKFLRPSVAPAIRSVRHGAAGIREDILSGVSPELLDLAGREFLTLDPNKTIWTGNPIDVASGVAAKFMQSLPSTLLVMLPAGRLFKAGNTAGALTYLGASEGGMSLGAIANNITDEIASMTHEQLMQESPRYGEIFATTQDETVARSEFTAEAQGVAPLVGGVTVASISLVTGRLLKPVFDPDKGMGAGRRVAQGFLAEAPQEGSQGAAERLAENIAAKIYDEDRGTFEGVGEAAVQEGVIGGLTGGAVAGAFGRRPDAPPIEEEGGQLNLPGFGPQQRDVADDEGGAIPIPETYMDDEGNLRTEDPAEMAQRTQGLPLQGGLDLQTPNRTYTTKDGEERPLPDDMQRTGRDISESTDFELVPPSADSETGTPEQGVLPMTLRERGKPVLQENPRGARLPDQLDQPTAEPGIDLQAQIDDMKKRNGRSAVYVSPDQTATQLNLPKTAVLIENFDGKGGVLIAKNKEAAKYARQRRASGGSMQAIIGELTLAGTGKPNVKAGYAVQLVGEDGAVARETLVATKSEADKKKKAWEKDGKVRVLTGPEALQRRSDILEREQTDLSHDQRAVDRRTDDLFDDTPSAPPAPEGPSDGGGGFAVRMIDDQNQLIDEKIYDTQEEADLDAELFRTDPELQNARVTVTPVRAKDKVEKARPAKTEKPAPYKSVEEKAADRARDELPFEERSQATTALKGAQNEEQAAGRLAELAKTEAKGERLRRIGGHVEPNQLEFNNAEQERQYREAWDKALDAELTLEMSGQAKAKVKARKDKAAALKVLSQVRQIDKPKIKQQRSERLARAAKKVHEPTARTRLRDVSKDVEKVDTSDIGELAVPTEPTTPTEQDYYLFLDDPVETWTHEQVDQLPDIELSWTDWQGVSHTKRVKPRNVEKEKARITEQFQKDAAKEGAKSKGPKIKGSAKTSTKDNPELSLAFEQAINSYVSRHATTSPTVDGRGSFNPETQEGYEASDTGRTLAGNIRATHLTPGRKVKFIKRELNAQLAEAAEVRKVKDTTIAKKPGGKRVRTYPLTTDKAKAEETPADKKARVEKSKKAKSRLRTILRAAKLHMQRFAKDKDGNPLNSGEYGTYIQNETNEKGELSKAGQDMLVAKAYFAELIQLADALLSADATSSASTTLANDIAGMLERIKLKSANPDKFASEWAALSRGTQAERITESLQKNEEAITDSNKDQMADIRRRERLEKLWSKDKIWNTVVAPILRKMVDARQRSVLLGGKSEYYAPTLEEVAALRYALRTWRKMVLRYPTKEFYNPLKETLRYYGFTFDAKGDIKVEPYTPSDALLAGRFKAQFDMSVTAAEEGTVKQQLPSGVIVEPSIPSPSTREQAPVTTREGSKVPEQRAPEIEQEQENRDLADRYDAVRGIRMFNAFLEKLKSRVAGSKVTINGIYRQEQRFIRALRKAGIWTDTGPQTGVISIGGFRSKTYRLVGPRLKNKTMRKDAAKEHINRLRPFTIPRELSKVAEFSEETQFYEVVEAMDSGPLSDTNIDFFLDEINLEENSPALDTAASRVGDTIRDQYQKADANTVLDEIIDSLPSNHFYSRLAKRLRELGMSNITVQYDWSGVKFRGRKKNNPGVYDPNTGRVYLNRSRMQGSNSTLTGTEAVHTILHELLHAATANAIKSNAKLATAYASMRSAALAEWKRRNGSKNIPYGLRPFKKGTMDPQPIDEFVAEVFASEELQDFLRDVPVTLDGPNVMSSIWNWIRNSLIDLLGYSNMPEINNLFDAFMAPADRVFEGAGVMTEGSDLLNMEAYDGPTRGIADRVWNKVMQHNGIWQRVKEAAKKGPRFTRAAMNLMTMEQFSEVFSQYFPDSSGAGSMLKRYFRAFQERNAKASRYMDVPEKLLREWVRIEESDMANDTRHALELSRIGTEATLNKVAADKPASDEANAHLSEGQKEVHTRLHERYNALSPEAKRMYEKLLDYYRAARVREQAFLLQSAMRGVLTGKEGSALTVDEFNEKFSIDILKTIEDRSGLEELVKDYINEEQARETVDNLQRMSLVPEQRQGNYFPLMRYGEETVYAELQHEDEVFGDHGEAMKRRSELAAQDPTLDVQVLEKEGKHHVRVFEREFVMAETKSEIEEAHARLQREYGSRGGTVYGAQRRMSKQMDSAIQSNEALNSILKTLVDNPAAAAAVKNFYLRNLADSSFRKHESRRRNRRGVDYDLQKRNLAAYSKQAAYYTAQLEYGWQMGEALRAMREFVKKRVDAPGTASTRDLSMVVDHITKRDALSADLPDVQDLIRKGVEGTHFFMLTSPSYWAINATQPWLVSLPTIAARHGYGETLTAMRTIQSMIKDPMLTQAAKSKGGIAALYNKAKTEEAFDVVHQLEDHIKDNAPEYADAYIKVLEELRNRHIIDINVFTEMRDTASGKQTGVWNNMVDASRIMAHLTEVNNRVLVSLAAYQLEINNGADHETALEYAGDMVSQTQFNYSSNNKPPLFQPGGPLGPVAPLMFQFMQWPQHMYAQIIRNFTGMVEAGVLEKSEARASLLGLLGTHAAVGGMVGMTLQPIKWAVGLTMMALGDEDEPYTFANAVSGRTFDRLIAEGTDEAFGTYVSQIISRGLPAAVGVDLSARMSMGTLYFVDLRGETAESALGSLVVSFGGASLNQALKFGLGMQKAMDGDVYKGVETMMPKIARDVMRSGRYYNEGLVNNAGDTVIAADDMSVWNLTSQAFGFQPLPVANAYSAQSTIKDAERYNIGRRERLLKDYRTATTGRERQDIMREIKEFNRTTPAEKISYSAVMSNRKSKRERERQFKRYGATIDEKKARYYRDRADPYR